MVRANTLEAARSGRIYRDLPIFQGHRTNYIATPDIQRPSPQAFLVEQGANFDLKAHFHGQAQFQVVAAGSGYLGAHRIAPFAIHYTSARVPYGPLVAGPEGVWYFTLRAVTNEGAFPMPESRGELRRGAKTTQFTVDPPPISDEAQLRARESVAVEELIAPLADGVAAWIMRVPPNTSAPAPVHGSSAGRFYVVAGGEMLIGGKVHPKLAVAWVSADEEPFQVQSSAAGLEVLALQYPEDALTVAA